MRNALKSWRFWVTVGIVLVVLVVVGGPWFFTRDYSSLNSSIKVAEICAVKTPTSRPTMDVHVILYKNSVINNTFVQPGLPGDHVQVQGDIIENWSALSFFNGQVYKLAYLYLKGYGQGGASWLISLNGDDGVYQTVHRLPSAVTPVVQALDQQPLSWLADGKTYDILASQNGLTKVQVQVPQPGCGFNRIQHGS